MKRYLQILGFICVALAVFLLVMDTQAVPFLAGRSNLVNGGALIFGALGVILLGVSSRR